MSVEDCIAWQNRFTMNGAFEWVLREDEGGEDRG